MSKQDKLFNKIVESKNLDEYANNYYEFMKEENQKERVTNFTSTLVDLVKDRLDDDAYSMVLGNLQEYLKVDDDTFREALEFYGTYLSEVLMLGWVGVEVDKKGDVTFSW